MVQQSQSGRRGDGGNRPLTVGISSTALFDLSVSNEIYQQEGLEAYRRYQISKEDTVLEPGDGFYLVEKLLNINKIFNEPRVEILLLSRNSADTGLRVFNSIKAHDWTGPAQHSAAGSRHIAISKPFIVTCFFPLMPTM